MVDRYAREEMKSKWSIQAKYQAWLDVEKAVVVERSAAICQLDSGHAVGEIDKASERVARDEVVARCRRRVEGDARLIVALRPGEIGEGESFDMHVSRR